MNKDEELEKEFEIEKENYSNLIDSNEDIDKNLEEYENEKEKYNKIIEEEIIEEEKPTRINKNKEKYEEIKQEDLTDEKEQIISKKKKSKKKLIIIISIILFIIISGLLSYFLLIKKENKIETKKENVYSEKNMKKIIKNYGEALENIIGISLEKDQKLLSFKKANDLIENEYEIVCDEKEIYDDGKIYIAKCEIDGHKTKGKYGEKKKEEAEVIEDGSFNVYVKDEIATLEEPKNTNGYETYKVTTNTHPEDITLLSVYNAKYVFYFDEDYNVHLKNFKTDKDAVNDNNITSVIPIKIREDEYDTTYVAIYNGTNYAFYNLNTGLKTTEFNYNEVNVPLTYGITGPTLYIEILTNNNIAVWNKKNKVGIIDYTNGDVIIPFNYTNMLRSGEYIWAYNYEYTENTENYSNETIYDFEGNKYLENKYDKLYGIVNGKYILVKENKEYKLILIDGKVKYNYGKIENLGEINYFISYNDEPIFQFSKKDTSIGDKDKKCIEVSYDRKSKKGLTKEYGCGGIAKPILYLYPEETTNVKVKFEKDKYLKTTYPKYKDKWEVVAKEDGTLTDKNGKNYYALYWDEKQIHAVDFKEGFYVTKKNAIKFLEEKLYKIGLTEKESNEFIMYWLPILENNKKSLVYFEFTKERESYNKLNIEPKPDSMLRLVIHIKKVDKKTKIKEEKIPTFERKGFTAVEWGGVNY